MLTVRRSEVGQFCLLSVFALGGGGLADGRLGALSGDEDVLQVMSGFCGTLSSSVLTVPED